MADHPTPVQGEALPVVASPLETIEFWAAEFAKDPQRLAGGMIVKLLNEYAYLRRSSKRDREADRLRFPDPDFNRWLDEGVSDAGHTVYDLVDSVVDAWHGWENFPMYHKEESDPTYPFESALNELVDKIVPGLDSGDSLADARTASQALDAREAAIYAERRAFEQWARDNEYADWRTENGEYKTALTRAAWKAWQSRAALNSTAKESADQWEGIKERCEHGIRWENRCGSCDKPQKDQQADKE